MLAAAAILAQTDVTPAAIAPAAHAALASVLASNLDRRAWHRAASNLGSSDDAASELEAAALRAQRRGATMVAITALECAAQ